MSISTRLFDGSTDYPALVEIINAFYDEPTTVGRLTDADNKLRTDLVRHRLIAEHDGAIVGAGSVFRQPYDRVGTYHISSIIVAPGFRRRGAGSALWNELEDFVVQHGGNLLVAQVRDNDRASLAFAVNRGFTVDRHLFELSLELNEFDPSPYQGLFERLETEEVRFFSLADLGESEDAKRELYSLNNETAADIPGADQTPHRCFEDFAKDVFDGYWYRADGQIVAAVGDRWAGMAAVGEIDPGIMYNMHTGVRREFRGRQLATALKVLAIGFARRSGARSIRTNNHPENAPMIAINRKLGYRQQPGWYRLEKRL